MEPSDSNRGRPEQRGYRGYRSRDDRSERDRAPREPDSHDRPSYPSSSSQNQRNPFSSDQRGGSQYGNPSNNGNGGGRYRSGGGSSGGDRYGNAGDDRRGGGGDRRGGGGYRGHGSGGDRYRGGGDRFGGGGDRYGGGGDRYGGDRNRSVGSGGSGSTGKRSPDQNEGPAPKRQFTGGDEAGPSSTCTGRARGPRKERDPNAEKKPRIDRYDIVCTLPESFTSKKGASGEHVRLKANFYELMQKPDYEMVMYRLDFEPECELAAKRKYLMYTQRDLLGAYLYDTRNSVYLTHRLSQDLITVDTADREKNPFKITIKFGTIVSMDTRESLQVLNLILRRSMEGLNLQLIGRNLFDAKAKVDFNNYNLQLWPGYTTSIRQHENSVLLCAEIASKIMRDETIYDVLRDCRNGGGDYQTRFNDSVLGLIVLTDYNNKTYKVDDIDYGSHPSDTFETRNGPITFIEYYRTKYNIQIRDPDQPMLITRSTERQRRGGEDDTISLIPELCRPTGLTDQQRNNFQLMKAIADHTRMDPRKRMMALDRFNKRLQTTAASLDILRAWNFKLDDRLVEIDGRVLKSENIVYGNGVKESPGQFADWQMAFKDKSMFLTFPLTNWCIVVPSKMMSQMQNFIRMMERASRQMRFEVAPAHVIDFDDRRKSYIQTMTEAANHSPQLIMVFVPNNNGDTYASIKKIACCDLGIPTQVVVQKTLNHKSLMSIATKVAIQLNCKLGGTPWLVEMPMKGLMTVGIDVSRDTNNKKISWGALVATMDLKNVTGESYYSCVSQYSNSVEFSTQLAIDTTKALRAYQGHQNAIPEKIVIYRDGVGEGQERYVYETELLQIKQRLQEIYDQHNMPLKLVFIVVSKKTNTRIFGYNQRNPQPGTVVDDVITQPEKYDFYLVAQTVRQGTVSPTLYNVMYDSLLLPPDRLQTMTYKQCHLYYNWAGTVRVPAVCQFAHKLTFLIAQSLHRLPSSQLEKKLYFL